MSAPIELRAPSIGETPPSQAEREFAATAGVFDDCLLLTDLPLRAQRLLRLVGEQRSIGHATLAARADHCATIQPAMEALLAAGLVGHTNKLRRAYRITEAGAALLQAAAEAPQPAAPRTFTRTGYYEGQELRHNCTRPGAYVAMQLPSLGACGGGRAA
ncbi:hypothetical protein [Polaromonas jejuensis]|uniref:Uncharacterized protein n=1 Tax=Polaromonas jejuensis TaxID=457502 RepID=A0ABW0QMY8_9BURK|nr:hypothetical protein [Polaromonas jejuensis]